MYSSRVVLSTASNGHPVYNTYIRWLTSSDEWCIAHRFAGYRDLNNSISDLGVTAAAPFPPTYSKSKFGIQLTARELEDRRATLEAWVCELLSNYDAFPENARYLIGQFFELEAHPAPVVRPSSPTAPSGDPAVASTTAAITAASPATAAPVSEAQQPRAQSPAQQQQQQQQQQSPEPKPGKKARTHSNMSTVSEPAKESGRQPSGEHQRTQSAASPPRSDLRSILSEKFMGVSTDAFRKDKTKSVRGMQPPPPPKPDKLHVAVRRGEEYKGHPTYETRLQFVRSGVGYTVTHRFAAFRTLETDLRQAQVLVQAKFPITHAKSSFGLKLSEPELQERARNLDLWMKEVLTSYHAYSDRAQLLIYDFLKLESCTNPDIEQSLIEGRVVASLEDAEKDDLDERHDIPEEQEEPAPTTAADAAAGHPAAKAVAVPNISTTSSAEQHLGGVDDDVQEHPLKEEPARRAGWWSCGCC